MATMGSRNNIQKRIERELIAHTENDVLLESYRLKNRFSHVWSFPSRKRLYALINSYLGDLTDKTVLDYGCGRGEASLAYLKRGANVDGIDISPDYIDYASHLVENARYTKERCTFHVMDAHLLKFKDQTFDFVVGFGILHHLEADAALAEIYRVLKPKGRVLLLEPLADNPLLKLFRSLTPQARTEDETPFSQNDIVRLTSRKQWRAKMGYCGVLEAPVAMLTSFLIPNHPENVLLQWADKLERWTHKRGVLLSWNQYVLFNMIK